jgi:alpha 1,3-glucosidase
MSEQLTPLGTPHRPQFLMFPNDDNGYSIDNQYYIGDSGLLVHPAVKDGVTSVDIYLAEEQPYYNFFTHNVYYGSSKGKKVNVPAPLTSQVPLLQRGGSILPLRERVRRAAELGWKDPFTLIVALDKPASSTHKDSTLRATGKLYLDDGDTYDYEGGDFIWRRFEWHTSSNDKSHSLSSKDETSLSQASSDTTQLSSAVKSGKGSFIEAIGTVRIEKIVVLGLEKSPKSIKVGEESIPFVWNSGVGASGSIMGGKSSELIVKDPKVLLVQDWQIHFE